MSTEIKKVNRKLGKVIAVIFGLCLLFEVACLPLLTSFAIQFDKTVVAEVNSETDLETFEQRTLEGIDFASLVPFKYFPLSKSLTQEQAIIRDQSRNPILPHPVFIHNHSFRV